MALLAGVQGRGDPIRMELPWIHRATPEQRRLWNAACNSLIYDMFRCYRTSPGVLQRQWDEFGGAQGLIRQWMLAKGFDHSHVERVGKYFTGRINAEMREEHTTLDDFMKNSRSFMLSYLLPEYIDGDGQKRIVGLKLMFQNAGRQSNDALLYAWRGVKAQEINSVPFLYPWLSKYSYEDYDMNVITSEYTITGNIEITLVFLPRRPLPPRAPSMMQEEGTVSWLDQLPSEMHLQFMANMDNATLQAYCRTSKRYADFCGDESMWLALLHMKGVDSEDPRMEGSLRDRYLISNSNFITFEQLNEVARMVQPRRQMPQGGFGMAIVISHPSNPEVVLLSKNETCRIVVRCLVDRRMVGAPVENMGVLWSQGVSNLTTKTLQQIMPRLDRDTRALAGYVSVTVKLLPLYYGTPSLLVTFGDIKYDRVGESGVDAGAPEADGV